MAEIDRRVETLELDVTEQGREVRAQSFFKVKVLRNCLASYVQCVCRFPAIVRAQASVGVEMHGPRSFACTGERWAMEVVANKHKFRLRERGWQRMKAK